MRKRILIPCLLLIVTTSACKRKAASEKSAHVTVPKSRGGRGKGKAKGKGTTASALAHIFANHLLRDTTNKAMPLLFSINLSTSSF
jgi:hypothetical protein